MLWNPHWKGVSKDSFAIEELSNFFLHFEACITALRDWHWNISASLLSLVYFCPSNFGLSPPFPEPGGQFFPTFRAHNIYVRKITSAMDRFSLMLLRAVIRNIASGSGWYLSETLKIFLDTLVSKHAFRYWRLSRRRRKTAQRMHCRKAKSTGLAKLFRHPCSDDFGAVAKAGISACF